MPLKLFDLLANGYFPIELPPPFTTSSFAQAVAGPGITTPNLSVKESTICTHNLARSGGLRRNLGIPNPIGYLTLANHIVKHWSQLKKLADASSFSLTKPRSGRNGRAISPEHSLDERPKHRARLRANERFLLRADISRFFPSIYTHSIPWAILGKKKAKNAYASRALDRTWQDFLDRYSRALNNNQTVGIPIGPDTSRLIAEVLLARIDVELKKRFTRLQGMRYIDDYEFVFTARSEAEDVLSYLQHLLNEFELALNPSKTVIVELPDYLDNLWVSKIRTFLFRYPKSSNQKNDLTAYFDMVFELFKLFPKESLIKYALARLRSEEIEQENWPFFESILSHCVLIEPACIRQVYRQVERYKMKHFRVTKQLWSDCLNRIVYERIPLGQSSEVAWAIWLMKLLKIKLLARSAKAIGNCEDSIVSLMALGLAATGLASKKYLKNLNRFGSITGLSGNQWLLCYQGNLMGWLGRGRSRVSLRSDQNFAYLERRNVSFFDIGATLPPVVAPMALSSVTTPGEIDSWSGPDSW